MGRDKAQVFVLDNQETRNSMTLDVLRKPRTGTTQHTSMPCCDFLLFLQTLVNSSVRKISLSSFSSGLSVCPKRPPFKVLHAPLALSGWQPAEPFTAGANPSPHLLGPACPHQSLHDDRGCLSSKLQGKPGHKGNWPATQTYPGTVYKQIWQ